MEGVDAITVGLKMRVDVPEQLIDVLKVGVGLHADVFVDVYLDAGGTEGEEAALAATEVGEQLVGVEGALDLGDLGAHFLALSADQTGSHSIN